MSKFEAILEESKLIHSFPRKIDFFTNSRATLIDELRESGETLDEARENRDVKLCENKIEEIKRNWDEAEKQSDAFRARVQTRLNRPRQTLGRSNEVPEGKGNTSETKSKETDEIIEGTLRQRCITLLILLFGTIEIPDRKEDLKTEIIDFVAFITGQSRQNAKKLLKNPTKYDPTSKPSRNKILADLRAVRAYFRRVDLKKAENLLTAEAKAILGFDAEELEEPQEKQKKS